MPRCKWSARYLSYNSAAMLPRLSYRLMCAINALATHARQSCTVPVYIQDVPLRKQNALQFCGTDPKGLKAIHLVAPAPASACEEWTTLWEKAPLLSWGSEPGSSCCTRVLTCQSSLCHTVHSLYYANMESRAVFEVDSWSHCHAFIFHKGVVHIPCFSVITAFHTVPVGNN